MSKKIRLVYEDERVCPECHKGPVLFMREGFAYCPAEDPHPGGVLIYADRTVRLDRHLRGTQLTPR